MCGSGTKSSPLCELLSCVAQHATTSLVKQEFPPDATPQDTIALLQKRGNVLKTSISSGFTTCEKSRSFDFGYNLSSWRGSKIRSTRVPEIWQSTLSHGASRSHRFRMTDPKKCPCRCAWCALTHDLEPAPTAAYPLRHVVQLDVALVRTFEHGLCGFHVSCDVRVHCVW